MNDTTVEQYFRGIRDTIKDLQRLFELIVVVMSDGLDPGLDFLFGHAVSFRDVGAWTKSLTCFKDIAANSNCYGHRSPNQGRSV